MEYPTYLVRPTDHSVFERNKDGMYRHKTTIKNYIDHEYSYDSLISCDFYPCEEKELKEIKKKHELYYKWLAWHTRSDGHGGSKGGTMEEYLELLKQYEIRS